MKKIKKKASSSTQKKKQPKEVGKAKIRWGTVKKIQLDSIGLAKVASFGML